MTVLLWEAPDPTSAANGCADIDGDGVVHISDFVIWGSYFGPGFGIPPLPPPQVDIVKDGELDVRDIQALVGRFDTKTSCQTDPLPQAVLADGALAVDASGEDLGAGRPLDAMRAALVGDSFRVGIRLTDNPGVIAYQARLHWDEAVLDLNPRTAPDNDVWQESAVSTALPVQTLGPADDNVGSDAYIELGAAPFSKLDAIPGFEAPVAQFEFACREEGTSSLHLAKDHSLLAVFPSLAYKPALSDAEIVCVAQDSTADTDRDGCADGEELGPNQALGGQRDPLNFWDFFDTPNPNATPQRDKVLDIGDILRLVLRFGTDDDGGAAAINRNTDPLSTPPKTGYHPAFDRTGMGPNNWNLGPPDGSIAIDDILRVVFQFGHNCQGSP